MGETAGHLYVFGDDRKIYGPATMELLKDWAREGLLSECTWIYCDEKDEWKTAKNFPELGADLVRCEKLDTAPAASAGIRPGQLRRMVLFADMPDPLLEKFVGVLEKVSVKAFNPVVKKGEHGDAMFLVLAGEARVVDRIEGMEKTLHTLDVGDFFGEVSLFDQGPRTADVVTNKDSTFLRISKGGFQKLMTDHPDVAASFLSSLARLMAARLRSTNKMYAASFLFGQAGQGQIQSPSGVARRK